MKHITRIALSLLLSCSIVSAAHAAGDATAGKAKFDQLCAQCHGATGAGDGPVGASLPPEMKPADLSKGEYKFAATQEKFAELLQKGGAAVGLNPLMPPQSGLTEDDVANLYAYIQSLVKK
jgi:cytochrome c553